MVVKTIYKRGNVPSNWGNVYVLKKVKALLENYGLEDTIQEIQVRIIEYYHPDHTLYQRRVRKLSEAEFGNSPVLGVKAMNRALNHASFHFPEEVPMDPSRVPKRA